jgi:hypothetical protein
MLPSAPAPTTSGGGFETAPTAPSPAPPTAGEGFEMLPEGAVPPDPGGIAALAPLPPAVVHAPARMVLARPAPPVADAGLGLASVELNQAAPAAELALAPAAALDLRPAREAPALASAATFVADTSSALAHFELLPEAAPRTAQLELFPIEALSPTSGAVVVGGFEMPAAALADVQTSSGPPGFEMIPEAALPPEPAPPAGAPSPSAGVVIVQGFEMLPAENADAIPATEPQGFEMLPDDPAPKP